MISLLCRPGAQIVTKLLEDLKAPTATYEYLSTIDSCDVIKQLGAYLKGKFTSLVTIVLKACHVLCLN